eukprot:909892_1
MLYVICAAIALLCHVARSQYSCSAFSEESTCNLNSTGTCRWVGPSDTGSCNCASEVKLDILFAVDTSGSIGLDGFQIQKQFLRTLVTQGINDGSKIGFVMFSTNVNFSRTITTWENTALDNYVKGLYWKGGYTNTPDVIEQSIEEFDGSKPGSHYVPESDRQQVLIMITDGNPCLPELLGGCPLSVCQFSTQIKTKGIRVVIIGVGSGLNDRFVKCLTQTDDDYIPVASFSTGDFASIMSSLSGVLCPIAKQFKITEVKAMRKFDCVPGSPGPPVIDDVGWCISGDGRYTRFIEFYNNGIEFNLNDITATGMIVMPNGGPDVAVPQGTYVVFYDAADELGIYRTDETSMPSCHLCGTDCDLSSCSFAGTGSDGYCWCGNSIYVGCKNQQDTDCLQGLFDDAGSTAHDGCSLCTFDNTMTKSNWNIKFNDKTTPDTVIDEVVYTGSPEWIETTEKYSYELMSKGMDNDYGGNWAESCSPLGTPGADPAANCDAICISSGCGGSGNVCLGTGQCQCDTATRYYPHCTSPTSCTKCLQVPTPGDCEVLWTKNGTTRRAEFTWNIADRDASTRYVLSHYSGSGSGSIAQIGLRGSQAVEDCDSCIWEPIYATPDYWPGNDTWGGYVQVAIDQCYTYQDKEAPYAEHTNCEVYYSEKTMCNVITSPPTEAPTPAPTDPPSRSPTPMPTVATTESSLSTTDVIASATIIDEQDCDNNESLDRDDCDESDDEPDDQCSVLISVSFDVCWIEAYKNKRDAFWWNVKQCACIEILAGTALDDKKTKHCYIENHLVSTRLDYEAYTTETEGDSDCRLQASFTIEIALYDSDCDYVYSVSKWFL